MQTIVVTLICIYHSFLRTIGKILGLLLAGLFVGFMQGTRDVKDMYKYLQYRALQAEARNRKREGDDDGSEGDNDT